MPQKAKKFWEFRASKTKNSAELLLYGPISEESWWGDEVTPKQFADELKSLGDVSELTVRINSGGGDVFAGQAIHSLLRSHQAKVTVYVDGLAASIASVIAMAGDTVVMPRNAMMMIHNPWTIGWGNANDFRRIADDLDKIRESIIAAYQDKSSIEREKLIELLDAETWLTAEEALEYGLVDEIDERKSISASMKGGMLVMNGVTFDVTGFKNVPNIIDTTTANSTEGKGVNIQMELTPDILAKQYPDIYNAVKQEGYNEGVKAERERFKALQELEAPGCEEILNQARYETGETAEQVAIKVVNVLKSSGANRLAAAIQDAAPLNQIDYQPVIQVKDDEASKVISAMAQAANKKRGVK
ncbi:MAG: Clp protease ClpP [Gorillibacterium sp.]|nr:Clp protease ClpP [Gorillibacterium sp.]